MLNKNLRKLCKRISKDLAELHKGDTASALWPFTTNEVEFYVGEFFIKDLYETIEKLKSKGYSDEQIAKLIEKPSKIAQYFTLFHSAKWLRLEERKKLANNLIDFISYYRVDPFCSNRTNILKPNVFNKRLLHLHLETDQEAIEIEKSISALLLLYLELLYPTMMRLGHEFHGPYKIKNKLLFIKEFYNLKSQHFKFAKFFPFEKLTLVEEINKKPEIDFFNHLFYMPPKKAVAILVNGKKLPSQEFKEIFEIVEKKIKKINSLCSNFTKKDWLKSLSKGLFYSIKNLKEKLNENYEPPRLLLKKIKNETFFIDIKKIKRFNVVHTKKQLQRIICKSFLKIFEL